MWFFEICKMKYETFAVAALACQETRESIRSAQFGAIEST